MSHHVPLSVLDLVPISSGSNAPTAIANTVRLAQRTEQLGYRRYWLAEHHLNPGVAGTTPALLMAIVANATSHIRVGSAAVQMGHQTPLAVVEQFGILDALHPGRIDLGLGRSGAPKPSALVGATTSGSVPSAAGPRVTDKGLVIPAAFSFAHLATAPRFRMQAALLQQPGARTPDYAAQVDELLSLLDGAYVDDDGNPAQVVPGTHAPIEVWVLGSSPGTSAHVAGARGLRFGANYHVAPSAVLDAIDAYRSAFRPCASLGRPYVTVSADVVVAPTDEEAAEVATGYGLWVRSIRTGQGAIPFPSPDEARAHQWSVADRELVSDRLATQFVGSPSSVADRLEVLAEETGADELLITTITHRHDDRVRSYELLAAEWKARESRLRAQRSRGLW
ncbi:MAG: LLM class flavin-dependent oxidoreductase [Actinobacteria bacterium]|nr:LLM class flavin-dependent oxidoreductase [Actinomycetota bacterium]